MSEIIFCDVIPEIKGEHVVYIESKEMKTKTDFLFSLGKQLDLPDYENCDWYNYLFWMKNLTWIPDRKISIIINDYENLLPQNPAYKSTVLFDLGYEVLHFWTQKANWVLEDEEYLKEIKIYCVE